MASVHKFSKLLNTTTLYMVLISCSTSKRSNNILMPFFSVESVFVRVISLWNA